MMLPTNFNPSPLSSSPSTSLSPSGFLSLSVPLPLSHFLFPAGSLSPPAPSLSPFLTRTGSLSPPVPLPLSLPHSCWVPPSLPSSIVLTPPLLQSPSLSPFLTPAGSLPLSLCHSPRLTFCMTQLRGQIKSGTASGRCTPLSGWKGWTGGGDAAQRGDTMARYTITYFVFRGRTETIRFLLADQGCEWKEDIVSIDDWHAGKVELKKTAIFAQLPMFADDGFIFFQSKAIFRYLARTYDLYGKNNKEAALIDMANDGMEDLREKFFHLFLYEWDTGKLKYVEDMPNQLRPFERLLSQNSSGFIGGSTVSFADYNLLDILQNQLFISKNCLDSFPHLMAFKKKMESRPKLKAYLESNDHKNRPFLLNKK